MNTKPQAPRRKASAALRALVVMLSMWVLGSFYMPAVAATSTAVLVDQQPLTVQPLIPPNVVLMLDDSGSMAWDYMPDWGYLTSSTGNGNPTNDQARNSAINGAYYNPSITYTPPPKADYTAANNDKYPDATSLTTAYKDGFTDTTATDITKFTGNFPYYTTFTVKNGQTYTATATVNYSCPNGGVMDGSTPPNCNTCPSGSTSDGGNPPTCYTCTTSGYSPKQKGNGTWVCSKSGKSDLSVSTVNRVTTVSTATTTYSCTASLDVLSGQTCTVWLKQGYFTYTTGSSNTQSYVGSTGTCAWLSTASPVPTGACVDDSTTQKNVANWFSYYRTRIQMAKSGLMSAFVTVDQSFRVGYGSIDGGCNGNSSNIFPAGATSTAATQTYTDTYHCGSGRSSVTNTIAAVRPFGTGTSANDTKTAFWNWVSKLTASGGTPLRLALDQVGQYYQTAQPWTTMTSDPGYGTTSQPSNIACRQAYTILTTDGFWNETLSSSTAAAGQSSAAWPTITGPNGQSWPTVAKSSPAAPYSGGGTGGTDPSLADVAMYYWETDLQNNTNFPNEVPTNTADPAFWQHMVTFTMGLGFTPTGIAGSATIGTRTDKPPTIADIFSVAGGSGTLSSDFAWPTPASNSIYNISDLAHAGVNGHGGFYSATNPATFASGLTDALNRASSRVGSGASLAANSTQLTNGTVAYQASYHTVQWTGDLLALSIDSSTGAISTTPTWLASSVLLGSATVVNKANTYPNRTIWTYAPGSAAAGTFVQFVNSSTGTPPALTTAELAALGSSATEQAGVVNYLRGDSTLEMANGGTYRSRVTPLGDIVDSQPVYSGAPNPNEFENQIFTGTSNTATTGNNSFQAFAVGTINTTTNVATPSAASKRTPLVFVAANDGMLHGFNSSTGAEVYAYLPGAVITAGKIKGLSDPNYGSTTSTSDPHQYYNDGELTIADAYFNSAWHTVLVGTTGRGLAEAVYALDITDPTNITPLWERAAGDGRANSNFIGQMVGKPVIAKVQDATTNSDWQVLIGNGYNSSSGTAALLEFNLATGDLQVHTTDPSTSNGLAAPVSWMDDPTTGVSAEAYAGDLLGRVWMFDLADVTSTTTGTTTKNTYAANFSSKGALQFSATDPSGNAQPITGGMLAGRDPITGNVWVFFGTGQYLSSGDATSKQVQSWYGVIVQAGTHSGTLPNLPVSTSDGSMVQRSITYELDGDPTANPPTLGVRTVTTLPSPSDMPGKRGWYMNLEQPVVDSKTGVVTSNTPQGERMVTPNQFQGNLLLGTTRIPTAASNADICSSSGSGWVMAVDPFTGTNPSGPFFLANGGDGRVKMPDGSYLPSAGVGFTALPNNPIFVGGDMLMSFDNGSTSSINTSGAAGPAQRVSWKELINP